MKCTTKTTNSRFMMPPVWSWRSGAAYRWPPMTATFYKRPPEVMLKFCSVKHGKSSLKEKCNIIHISTSKFILCVLNQRTGDGFGCPPHFRKAEYWKYFEHFWKVFNQLLQNISKHFRILRVVTKRLVKSGFAHAIGNIWLLVAFGPLQCQVAF